MEKPFPGALLPRDKDSTHLKSDDIKESLGFPSSFKISVKFKIKYSISIELS